MRRCPRALPGSRGQRGDLPGERSACGERNPNDRWISEPQCRPTRPGESPRIVLSILPASNQNAVWTSTSTKPPRAATKGWTPLKVVLSAILLFGGALAVIAGAATWHSVESRPHVVARVVRPFHCVSNPDTGTACDERIAFEVGNRQIHTVVRGIEPSRDLYGPPGHQSITIFYDPAAPSHVEGVDGVALDGIAMILGGIATIIGVDVIGALITRDGRKLGSGPTPISEIHRSIVS
jgi:hypothetical protein